ncbi:Nif11-like leader peptide family natural product precursor [Calothrix sp. CCY 0018]|uniref:Nif11-like leader peptide family natural product precursor n=1 Tax=Calothrix sp. CCY 0018 TaxID=3103864 RepID=UPI0039C5EE46
MSLKAAFKFIRAVRERQDLQTSLQDLGQAVGGEELVKLGKETGFDYTEVELQAAFKHDWVMRSFRHGIIQAPEKR